MNFKRPLLTPRAGEAGITIVETVFALVIMGITIGGVMLMNSQQLKMVKSVRDTNAAALCMQERVEQMRIATWPQMTNTTYLRDTYFASTPRSAAPLGSFVEKVTVQPYVSVASTSSALPTVASQIVVQRKNGQPAEIVSSADLSGERLARVLVDLTWTGKEGAPHSRQYTTVISNSGVNRFTLPAMGDGSQSPGNSSGGTTTGGTTTGNGNGNGNGSSSGTTTGNGRGKANGQTGKG